MDKIRTGKYRHYRNGQLYEVIGIAYNADNDVAATRWKNHMCFISQAIMKASGCGHWRSLQKSWSMTAKLWKDSLL